ncbi:hypothetical protein ACFRDV_22395 [Streptomyces fagopyri]|uniref:hypothetical protein n=1 Tax=Streptomyces fagopyri TaxID=2662397 RepID=UPI00368E2890
MNLARDLYLGWTPFAHEPACTNPVWEPEARMEHGLRGRLNVADQAHGCPAEGCEHDNVYPRYVIRLVCAGCGVVHLIRGEDVGKDRLTTAKIGFGQPPREIHGVWLWPGEQNLPGIDDEPRDWLITRAPVRPRQADDVAGTICRHRTAGGLLRWQASAIADSTGPYGDDQLRWARRQSDLRSADSAAEWIATQYQPQKVEVAV